MTAQSDYETAAADEATAYGTWHAAQAAHDSDPTGEGLEAAEAAALVTLNDARALTASTRLVYRRSDLDAATTAHGLHGRGGTAETKATQDAAEDALRHALRPETFNCGEAGAR
jgi:hypothetical protein